jgi:integrase/recombinase XerC
VSLVHTRDVLEGVGGAQLVVHGKGGKERVVPISDSLGDAIRAHAPKDDWLFPNGFGSHLSPYQVGQLVVRVLPGG